MRMHSYIYVFIHMYLCVLDIAWVVWCFVCMIFTLHILCGTPVDECLYIKLCAIDLILPFLYGSCADFSLNVTTLCPYVIIRRTICSRMNCWGFVSFRSLSKIERNKA